jgi:nucleoside-diphosphate kinase
MTLERTLIIFKPDSIQRGLIGRIMGRFEDVGLRIVGMKMVRPDYDQFHHHYEKIGKMISRRGEEVFKVTLEMMSSGPVILVVLEGIEAVSLVRKMVGNTEPKSALPGTIRGDFAHMSYAHGDANKVGIPNLIHASGDKDEAELEINHWFKKEELFDYETVHQKFTQTKKK